LVSSKIKRPSQVSFFKQLPRHEEVFGSSSSGIFYGGNKEMTMPRLDIGITKMSKAQERLAASPSQKFAESSIIDYKQVVQASTDRLKPSKISYTNLGKQQSRDEILYRQDDRWSNVMLDNSK
jgi:hypothetical protein